MNRAKFSCLIISLLVLHSALVDSKGPLVWFKSGSLRGKYVNVKGTDTVVQTYLGVPYALPPVGSRRLAPPLPAEPWEGERDATQQPAMCLQDTQTLVDLAKNMSLQMELPGISEDCLYLNIYTPAKPNTDSKLPVMVWIHGGGFVLGAASMYDGSALAAYQDVVVVLIQYRLGIMGFLSTGDEHIPGNYGLLDQVVALRWVQENIHIFGGDPGLVTIFGESAGGMSVSLQLLSPLSSGLFHRAIAESGTAALESLLNANPLPIAQLVANATGCDSTSSKTIQQCMMQLTEDDIINNFEKLQMIFLGVSNDGVFLTKSTEESFQNHEVHKVPFMTGVTNMEFGWLMPNSMAPPGWVDGMDRDQVMHMLPLLYPKATNPRIKELILDEYLGTSEDRLTIRDGFLELMGDLIFTIPAIRTANFHRDAGVPVYLYEFQHAPSILQDTRPSFTKSDHTDEIFSVFGSCFWDGHIKIGHEDKDPCTQQEKQLAHTVMAYWGNFARTGSPNGAGLVEWPQYGQEEEYLELDLEQRPGHHLKEKRFVFMTQTVPDRARDLQEQNEHNEL